MAQFKVYGQRAHLQQAHAAISDCLHAVSVRTLKLPADKRFHRFIPLEAWQLVTPKDRSERYLVVEIHMFSGRTVETRKALVRAVMDDLSRTLALHPNDVEVVILESARENWGIRGQHGDELTLSYRVDV